MEKPFDTRHILSPGEGTLADVISAAACVPTERVMELIELGAVYVEGKRADSNASVGAGAYLRVHLKPKRYSVDDIDWANSIVYQDEYMVVVNKPAGLPVHPMLDNKFENVATQLARYLGAPLFVTQRLDVETRGLFVLAKTKEFQRAFNGALNARRIYKSYVARLVKKIEPGEYRHFMLESPRSPKTIADSPSADGRWLECVLRVVNVRTHETEFETEIELITGRTHQIRAQLAHLGAPLTGDKTYGTMGPNRFYLVCNRLKFENPLTSELRDFILG